jgi:glycosyltransferase involved in cell wall biosynthesis
MTSFTPKVSIVIPVYNGSNYLKEAIDSALAQTYKNIEIIVINDGSNDDGATEEIAKSYGDKIRYYSKKNGGVATALNLGIEKMAGEYFSWLSHDDKYLSDRTEKMVHRLSLESKTEDLIIASSYKYFTESTEYSPVRSSRYSPSHPLSYLFLGYINGCSVLIPKQVTLRTGCFNIELPTTQDFDYWFRALRKSRIIYLDDELTLSRSHVEQGSKAMLKAHVKECDELWINIVSTLNKSEKVRVFGGEFEFYTIVHDFLSNNTLYIGAIKYIKKCLFEVIKESGFDNSKRPDFIDDWSVKLEESKRNIFFPIFGHFTDRGGLNKMVSMVANRLSQSYNVIVASFTEKDGGYELNDKITYIRVSTNHLGINSFEDISILFDVDVTTVSHNCSAQGLELIDRLKSGNRSVLAWNHEDYFRPYTDPKFTDIWPIRSKVLSRADAVIWPTNASCMAYSLMASNSIVIPNFVHFENKNDLIDNRSIHNNIIAIARFDDPQKRINLLLKTYENIRLHRKDISLTILGVVDHKMMYSETESIGDAIARINTDSKNIILTGFVDDIKQYYTNSDLQILPSYGEGFGLTILESAYYGVPTAVFDNSGFRDIITDNKDGIIAPEADTNELARRVVELLNSKNKLIKMKKSSRKIIKNFDENTIVNEWKRIINNILYDKSIVFNGNSLNGLVVKKISNGYENALIQFSNNFDFAIMADLKEANTRLAQENNILAQENNILAQENNNLSQATRAVYDSKRWKFITKLANIMNRLLK